MRFPSARSQARVPILSVAVAAIALACLAVPNDASGASGPVASAKRTAHRWTARCPAPYPLTKIHAGLRGTGYTTVKGTHPEPFAVRVLGVLKDGISPGIDMIVITTHSAAVKTHGTWEGMSGSPIYAADGRLIGALSYGLSFGATNKAGVTPAAAMYQMRSDRRGPAAFYAKHVAVPNSMGATAADNGAAGGSAADLQLLPTPIMVTGMPSRWQSGLRLRLRQAGLAPFSLHAGSARGAQRHQVRPQLRPGGPFAVSIAYGDYTIGGVGTVTAICGNKVLAFGHPMALSGATTETAHAARVLYVQRDPTGPSFVMANIGPVVGALDQDRMPGVRATLGAKPSTTGIITHVEAPATGLRRTGVTHTSLVDEVADAAGGALFGSLLSTAQHEGAGSSTYSFTASGRMDDGTPWRFHRSDQTTDASDVEFGTSWQLYTTLATIIGNPYDGLSVKRVSVHARATEKVAEWELRDLEVDQDGAWQDVTPATTFDVSPGDVLQLRATLQAYRDSHATKTVDISVRVPESAGSGPGTIQVAGGGDLALQGPDMSTVNSFSELLASLHAVPHGGDLVTQLSAPDSSGSTTVVKTLRDRLKRVTRGVLALQLNVGSICTDCPVDEDPPLAE